MRDEWILSAQQDLHPQGSKFSLEVSKSVEAVKVPLKADLRAKH